MKRQFIKISDVDIFDEFHYQSGDSFEVNQQLDGNTTEYHKQGINIVKEHLNNGLKIRPILVLRNGDRYKLLDGFKRIYACKELGYPHVEAFICDELDPRGLHPELKEMRACKGGQSGFSLFEGNVPDEKILSWDGNVEHVRIELAEHVHIHWGLYGKYRFDLGRRDFDILAKAINKI